MPFSKRLYEETKSAHEQVESMDFVVSLRNQKLSQTDYVQYLTDLILVYSALEECLRTNLGITAIQTLYDDRLCRTKKLEKDIQSFQEEKLIPSKAAQDYAKHLKELSTQSPLLLLAHSYVRYLGDLSGGRMMKKFVEQLFPGEHTHFYNFDEALGENAIGTKFVEYKNGWKQKLDSLSLTDEEKRDLIEEAKKGFEYTGRIFSRCYTETH